MRETSDGEEAHAVKKVKGVPLSTTRVPEQGAEQFWGKEEDDWGGGKEEE